MDQPDDRDNHPDQSCIRLAYTPVSTNAEPQNADGRLTGIPDADTLAATNEAEAMMVKQFLDTLAEIALAVASRKAVK